MIKLRAVLEMFTKGTDKAKKEVGQINDQLDQAADNAARMNRTLSRTKTGQKAMDRAGVSDTVNYRTQRGIAGTRGAEGRNFSALARSAEGPQGSFVGAYAAIAANVFALTAAFQALSNAAKVEQLTKGLELLGARGGVALKTTAKNLRLVTDNALSTADSMKAVAMASSAGFGDKEIARLGSVARGASLALGRDMSDALDRLVKGTIKLEPELLDELGIMTRLDDAVRDYADANRKAASALTQTERRQAFMNAVLEEGERKFGDIADQIEASPYDQLSASIRQTATELGTFINKFLKPVAKFFADSPFALIIPGIFLATKALQGLGIAGATASLNIEKAFDAAYRRGEGIRGSKSTQTIFEGVATRPGHINSLRELSLAFKEEEAAFKAKNRALKFGEKSSLAYNKALLMTSFTARSAAIAVRGLGVAIATAALPMLVMTAIVASLTWAFSQALKAWDKFTGNTKEIKESKARMKELADQAKDTAEQVRIMLEPGKMQAGNAFDAIVNSAKAASDEIDRYNKALERKTEIEDKNIKVGTGLFTVSQKRGGGRTVRDLTFVEATEKAASMEGAFSDPKITEQTITLEAAYKRLEKSAKKQLDITQEEAKLLIGNAKIIFSQLSVEDEARALSETNVENLQKKLKTVGEILVRFKDLEESAKNINKLGRDLFPIENKNALRDLSEEFNNMYNAIKLDVDETVSDTFARGIADNFSAQKSGLQATLVALSNQEGSKEKVLALQKEFNVLLDLEAKQEEALSNLRKAKALGIEENIQKAEEAYEIAQKNLGVAVIQKPELQKQLALYTKILSVFEDITKESLKLKSLQEKLAKQNADNAKSALEYSKAMENAARVATGADITLPEEFTYAYQAKIADLELSTAREIAKIKKESIDLQMKLDIFTLANQKKQLEIDTAIIGTGEERDRRGTAKDIVFDNENKLRSQEEILRQLENVTEYEIATLVSKNLQLGTIEEQVYLTEQLAEAASAGAQAEEKRAEGISANANARLEATQKQEFINIRNLKNLDETLKAENEITKIRNEAIDSIIGQSESYKDISAILKTEALPSLLIQQGIIENQIKLQESLLDDSNESIKLTKEERIEYQRKLDLLKSQKSVIEAQTDSIVSNANAYIAGSKAQSTLITDATKATLEQIQGEQVRLDLLDKSLQIRKEELSLAKELRDATLTTERQIAEAAASKLGGTVSGQDARDFAIKEADNRIANLKDEKSLLEEEKTLVKERMEFEQKLMEIRLTEAELNLQTALTNAREAGVDDSSIEKAQKGLATIESARGLMESTFQRQMISLFGSDGYGGQFGKRLSIIDKKIEGEEAARGGISRSAQEEGQKILAGLGKQLATTIGGFGLTGGAADFYADERQSILNRTEPGADRDRELKNLRAISFEMQQQQTLAEGLEDIFANLGDSISDAFVSMIEGSKSAKEAFGEMARQILRDLAQMIIKMITFKLIEAGLNMIPGVGPGLSAGFRALTGGAAAGGVIPAAAAGGIIPLATGGVMDRALGVQGVVRQPTYLVGEGRYNEAVVPLPNGRSIPVQMHGGGSSQSNNVSVNVNMTNNGSQTQSEGQDPAKLGQAIAAAVQRELVAQKAPGGLLNRYSAI